ncbi:MAG: mobile mystery protein B [Acidimicrobiales bacterium]
MSDGEQSLEAFSIKSIGPEPNGATPIEEEDLNGLIPDFVATRADLNRVEYDNISKALPWGIQQARTLGPNGILEYGFLMRLHRQMFEDVWRWAGTKRLRVANIGSSPELIVSEACQALDDMKYWHANATFSHDERAARLHCQLVKIHPFPNGNGRCTRLFADLYLVAIEEPMFSWGSRSIDVDGDARKRYIDALVKARNEYDFADLTAFARS